MIILYAAIGWLVGLYLAAAVPAAQTLWLYIIIIGVLSTLLFRQNMTMRILSICMIAAGLGLWRTSTAQMEITSSHVASYNDAGYAELIGMVSDAPDVRDNAIRLRISVERYRRFEVQENVHGDVLVYADRLGDFRYGDWVRVSGLIQTPTVFDTFSWRDYLARQGVYSVVFRAQVTVLGRDRGSPIMAALLNTRDAARDVIYKVLPSPSSDFMAGILLGDESGFSPEVTASFRKTGTSHLIAISGANMVVVIGLLHAVFSRLFNHQRSAVIFSIIGIAIYTAFVGAGGSVLRAAIMSSLGLIAQRFGRRSDGLTSLAVTFALLTVINPNAAFDLGLIFSAAATLGLLLYLPPLQKMTEKGLKRLFHAHTAQQIARILTDVVLIGIAAQITVLPLMIYFFQEFSLVSFPVNILVAPVQAPLMIFGIVMTFLGMVWLPLGQIVAWFVQLPLAYMLSIIRSGAAIPGSTTTVQLTPFFLLVYYALLLAAPQFASASADQRKALLNYLRRAINASFVTLGSLGIALLVWSAVLARPDGKLHVHLLDVGEGIGILLQTPNGMHFLLNGGENPTRLQTALGDRLPLFKNFIDVLIVTDMRRVTIAALPPLLDRYEIGSVFYNALEAGERADKTLVNAFNRHGKQGIPIYDGTTFRTDDGVGIEILHAASTKANPLPQDTALVLRVTYGDSSFLITSEMSEEAISLLLDAHRLLPSTVLLLPSNGRANINPERLIEQVSPQVALIAADAGDSAAMPAGNVLNQLGDRTLFRTDEHGSVEIVSDGSTLWVFSTRHP